MTEIAVNDVVQINPESDPKWGGCFLVVTEVKSWGIQGWLRIPMQSGSAHYRAPYEHIARVGVAEWVLK